MSFHEPLITVGRALGYSISEDGCCEGASLRWLEAFFLDEETVFQARLLRISQLAAEMSGAHEQNSQLLSDERLNGDDILAFYDSLVLYQSPDHYSALFHTSYISQLDIERISVMAASDGIQDLGYLKQFYSHPICYTGSEFKDYLASLDTVLSQSTERLGVILNSNNHAIALGYIPERGWRLMDINGSYNNDDIKNVDYLAEQIASCFNEISGDAINISVLTPSHHLQKNVSQALDVLKTTQAFTGRRAIFSNDLLFIASKCGLEAIVSRLLKCSGINVNAATIEGETALFCAAREGHVAIVAELIKHQAAQQCFTSTVGDLRAFASTRGHAVIERMDDFLSHTKPSADSTSISMMPSDIARVMGDKNIIRLLYQHNKINHVQEKIKVLINDGEQLVGQNSKKTVQEGNKTLLLAKKLNASLGMFIDALSTPHLKYKMQCATNRFKHAIKNSYQKMDASQAALWGPILAEISLSAKELGLLEIVAHRQHNNALFFSRAKPIDERVEIISRATQ